MISNEYADAAAEARADHVGKHDKRLTQEEMHKATLWKVLKRISAIELHIRETTDVVPTTAESILAKTEVATADGKPKLTKEIKRTLSSWTM